MSGGLFGADCEGAGGVVGVVIVPELGAPAEGAARRANHDGQGALWKPEPRGCARGVFENVIEETGV